MQKSGCSLGNPPPGSLILDMDEDGAPVKPRATKCDYLLFAQGESELLFCPTEMKGGAASRALKQLQAGSDIGAKMLDACRQPVHFKPIFVKRGGGHSDVYREFQARRIAFRRRGRKPMRKYVRVIRAGSDLQKELQESRTLLQSRAPESRNLAGWPTDLGSGCQWPGARRALIGGGSHQEFAFFQSAGL